MRTPISYIRRGPFPSLACDSICGASLTVPTQARPPGPALAAAPEAHPLRRLGAAGPAVRDEEGDQFTGRRHRRAHGAGLVVAEAYGPAGRASVQVVAVLRSRRRARAEHCPGCETARSLRWRAGGIEVPSRTRAPARSARLPARGARPRKVRETKSYCCYTTCSTSDGTSTRRRRNLRAQ